MENETREHLLKLASLSPKFDEIYIEHVQYWGLDNIPKIVTYAEIGVQIGNEFDKYDENMSKKLFTLIEEGMNGDYELSTAVATGLLEALYSRTDDLGNWTRVKECLGAESRRFADLMSGTEANGDPAEHRE